MTLSYFKSAPALGSESSVIAMFSPLVLPGISVLTSPSVVNVHLRESEYNFYVYSGGFVKGEKPPPRAAREAAALSARL
jgi:hypothetical protein